MNDEDRAALAAWKDYRAAESMLDQVNKGLSEPRRLHARIIAQTLFDAWHVALAVATLKGGR